MIRTEDIRGVTEGNVHGSGGDKIGAVGQIYLDNQSGQPAWVTVKTGLFGTKASFVPLAEASVDGKDLRVPYDKETIKHAPNVDADGELTPAEEDELYRYYGVESGGQQDSGEHANSADRSRLGQDESAGRDTAGTAAAGGVSGHRAGHGDDSAERHRDERQEHSSDRERHGKQDEHREHGGKEEEGAHRHEDDGGSQGGPQRRIRRYIVTEEVITRREEELPDGGDQPEHTRTSDR